MTFTSLKRRIVISLILGVASCFVLMSVISYNAIYTIQHNKIKSTMIFNLDQQEAKLNQSYNNLLLFTQQMMPQGTIGSLADGYYSEKGPYMRSVLSRSVSSNIGLITFSNPSVQLVMYYNPEKLKVDFSDMPLRSKFAIGSLPYISSYADITYQSPHLSQCRFSKDLVISVTRKITFSNGDQRVIYIEAKSDAASDMLELSKSANMPYLLVMLDKFGNVRYSSDPKIFRTDTKLTLNGESGIIDGYIWCKKESDSGYKIALLTTTYSFNRELYAWRSNMVLILIIELLIMVLISFVLLKIIYKPLRIFEVEMESIGKGQMDTLHYHTGVDEFDKLFDQFNEMKRQIQQLIADVELKEKRRHQLEIEKMAYQINPHFLLNSLNSVHWLAVMHKQNEIDRYVSKLNLLLSYNLGKTMESATLHTEIKMLFAYLEVQQMRYDFTVVSNIADGAYLDMPIARFILQPIAENAICHGLDEGGTLEINILPHESQQTIMIIIHNNGKEIEQRILNLILQDHDDKLDSQRMSKGIGLCYVRYMLESFYGNAARMVIESNVQIGTTVTLYLPFRQEKKE